MKHFLLRVFLLSLAFNFFIQNIEAQLCDDSPIGVVSSSLCIEERVEFNNSPAGYDLYEWDFCIGELDSIPNSNASLTEPTLNVPVGISIVKNESNFYGFVCSRSGNEIFVLDFGDDVSSTPIVINRIRSASMNSPEWIELVKEGDSWVGFVLNFNDDNLLRLHFDNGFETDPSEDNLGDLEGSMSDARGLELVKSGNANHLFISNTGIDQILRIEAENQNWLGNLLVSNMDTLTTNGIDGPLGLSLIDSCGYWYGIVSSNANNRYYHLNFGNDLTSNPDITNLGVSPMSPTDVRFVEDGGYYYAFGTGAAGTLYKLNFETNPASLNAFTSMGNFGGDLNNAFGFEMIKDSSSWHAFSMSFSTKRLTRLDFPENCNATVDYSNDSIPVGVYYQSQGIKTIGLNAKNTTGGRTSSSLQVTVSPNTAPTIEFTIDDNRCISNANTFTPSLSGLIYSWDFDGDGIEDSDQETPTFQFSADGIYEVRLDVNDGICDNFYEQEITMLNEPPQPSFTIGGSLCNNNQLTLTNTTNETGFNEGDLVFSWVFSGQDSTVSKNAQYTFSQPGDQRIKLYASISGCVTVIDSLITLGEGTNPEFSWTNNCLNDSISFFNESVGSNLTFSWDFGDGHMSSLENPKHQYSVADTFNVTLEVINEGNCVTSISRPLIVNHNNLVDVSIGEAVENLPVMFSGIDLTSIQDSIVEWNWDFGGLGTSSEQNPSFTFSDQSDYSIELVVTTSQGCLDTLVTMLTVRDAECPSVSFSLVEDSVCIGENLDIINSTVNAQIFEWDFCPGELDSIPTSSYTHTNMTLDIPVGLSTVIDDGIYYNLIANRNGNSLVINEIGNIIDDSVAISRELTDSLLNGPEWIELVKQDTNNVAYVLNFNDARIIRINFGASLKNNPTYENLGNLNDFLSLPRGLELADDSKSKYLFVTDHNRDVLVRSKIESGWLGSIDNINYDTLGELTSINQPIGIDLIDSCGYWYGIVSSNGNDKYFHLDFGTDLSSTPSITDLGVVPNDPTEVKWVVDAGKYYVFGVGALGNLYKLDFGESPSTLNSFTDLGDLEILDDSFGFDMIKDSSRWRGFSMNFSSNQLTRIDFQDNCDSNTEVFFGQNPVGIHYNSSGSKIIALAAIDENGKTDITTQQITVMSNVSPDISFMIDASRCISNANTFTPNLSGLTSYSWDFDGDGMEDSDVESPTYQYASTGIYTIRLDVSDGMCSNFTEQEVTIYEEPPIPDFTVTTLGTFCTGNELMLNNNTDESGYDDRLTYQWVIDGDIIDQQDTVYTFLNPGVKTITLQSFLPGCSSIITSEDITINEGPEVGFTYINNCFGEPVQFTSEVTGTDITNFSWDFGDGEGTSSKPDTVYQYAIAGMYTVQLSVTNSSGCETVYSEKITINDDSLVDFTVGEAIENLPIEFKGLDLTLMNDSIESWEWDFNGDGSSTIQDTVFTFPTGSFDVELMVTTAQGCTESISKQIFVSEASCPAPNFNLDASSYCIGEEIELTNSSINAISYAWDFCTGDLGSLPTIDTFVNIENTSIPIGFRLYDSLSFISSRSTNEIHVYNYSKGFGGTPELVTILSDPLFDAPEWIEVVREGTSIVLFVNNLIGPNLIRVEIEDLGMGIVSYEDLGDLGGVLQLPKGMELVESSSGEKFLFVLDRNQNAIIRTPILGDSWLGSLDEANLEILGAGSGISIPNQLSIEQTCTGWYGLISSIGNDKYYHLDFGSDVGGSVTITDLGLVVDRPTEIRIVNDGGDYYGFGTGRGGNIYRLNFGADLSTLNTFEDLGDYGGNLNEAFGFDMVFVSDSSRWYGYSLNFSTRNLTTLSFSEDCSSSIFGSTSVNPTVSYSSSGNYRIGLSAFDEDGNYSYTSKEVTITTDVSPDISFMIDASRCISNANTFTPNLSGLTSYSWDFDGDGMEDSDVESPTYQYASTGTYTIRLDVSDGMCSNFTEQEVTIYEEPPIPDFTVTTLGTFCTGNELMLNNNTDESGYDDRLTYQWVIDGDIIDQQDTVYTFLNPGVKTITLQSFLPGCSSIITSEDITINEGPEVGFTYINNCFGEPVQFTSEVTGTDITNFSWDFGDGEGTSSKPDTVYQYAIAGMYTVQLSVTNSSGCETVYSEKITINDDSLVDFTVGEAIENLPIEFKGLDLTLMNDSIESWEWDFNGDGSSTIQDTVFTFPTGSFDVELMVTTAQGCTESISKQIFVSEASCPAPNFNLDASSYCIGEEIELTNSSINAISYAWDFCTGDLGSLPTIDTFVNIENTSIPIGFRLYDSLSFISSRSTNEIHVYNYSKGFGGTPELVTILSDPLFDAPEWIEVVREGTSIVLFVNNLIGPNLIRVEIEDLGMGIVSYEDLGDLGGVLQLPKGMELVESSSGEKFLFVLDRNQNAIIRTPILGDSWLGSLDEANLEILGAGSGISIPNQLSIEQTCTGWYGLISSIGNDKYYHLDFGSDVGGSVTITDLGLVVDRPTEIRIVNDGGDYYGFGTGRGGNIYRLNFGADLSTLNTFEDLGDYGGNLNEAFGFDMVFVSDSSRWYGYSLNFSTRNLTTLSFSEDCSSSIFGSTSVNPTVSYSSSGNYRIGLSAFDEDGNYSYTSKEVTITTDVSPDISFMIDASRCISNANTFTPNLSGLTSYSWDFDGDGMEDSDVESPTYQYASTGTYTIRLDVSDGMCSNFTEQEITIYPEPPVPSFDITPSTYCLGSELTLTNTTDETGLEEVITYTWDLGNDSEVTTKDASISYNTSGAKTITLTASIPGCETTIQQTIEILAGPTSSFASSFACQNEVTVFTNNSTDAMSYHWDFGDGFESTAENPTHLYAAAGSYLTTLTTTDANGCTNEITNEVIVETIPNAAFDFELACSSMEGVQFTDMSTVENSDVVGWEWLVDGESVSTSQNPIITFESGGVKNIRLIVQSSNGCESSHQEDINIRSSPNPDFTFSIGCQGEISSFSDITSDVGNPVTQWLWTIEGETYASENVDHIFESNGLFDITLEVTTENFCSETITKTIEVKQLPSVNFSIDGSCSNEIISLIDNSEDFDDAIISRSWLIDGQAIGNGSEILIDQLTAGSYDVELEVETSAGCLVASTQEIIINPTPMASFEASSFYGLPGDEIVFTNSTIGGTTYQWLLNNVPFSNSSDTESITFSETGTHKVSLVSFNSFGCSDTTNLDVLIQIPEVDLVIQNFEIIEQNGVGKIFLDIQNLSNLPVEVIDVIINLEDNLSASEQALQLVNIGSTERIALDVGIPLTFSKPSFICVNLQSQYQDYEDKNPLNNEKCLTLNPKVQVEAPFPNPVRDEFRMKVVLPEEAQANVSLVNSVGKIEQSDSYNMEEGLNNIFIDMSELSTGIYFVNIDVMGEIMVYRIVKL